MISKENTIIAVCTLLVVVLFIVGMALYFIHDNNEAERLTLIYENADTTGTVIDKHTFERKGTHFHIIVEYDSTDMSGEKTTFTQEYRIPWEDYVQIEIGDAIISSYNNKVNPTVVSGWDYITFVKTEDAP